MPRDTPKTTRPAAPRWVGAKGGEGVWHRIISTMPPHDTFIEMFAGTGIITANKRPAGRTIVIDKDPDAPALALPGVHAICGDAVDALHKRRAQLTPRTLVYADPPYLRAVRSCKRDYYRHELATEAEHLALLEFLRGLPCMVILSGYWSDLYTRELADWRTESFWTTNRRGRRVREWLWMNFPEPFELHDYRFLGDGWRERQRIRRKKTRHVNRLLSMPPLERAAVLAAIDEARTSWGNASK